MAAKKFKHKIFAIIIIIFINPLLQGEELPVLNKQKKELPGNVSTIDDRLSSINWNNPHDENQWGDSEEDKLKDRDFNTERPMKKSPGIIPYFSLGLASPIADYGDRYDSAMLFSFGTSIERYSFYGLVPEAFIKYSRLESLNREGVVDTGISLIQISAGIKYSYETGLPRFISKYEFFKRPVTLYGRVTEGISRLSFESDNRNGAIVEYINTVELSVGFMYPVYSTVNAGLDFGYRYIATKDVPLQSFDVMMVVGVRL